MKENRIVSSIRSQEARTNQMRLNKMVLVSHIRFYWDLMRAEEKKMINYFILCHSQRFVEQTITQLFPF